MLFGEVRVDRMTQADTKIGLLDHVGGGNLGDDATLAAVAANIRRRWPNVEIVAFSMNPDDTEKRHGIMSGERAGASGISLRELRRLSQRR